MNKILEKKIYENPKIVLSIPDIDSNLIGLAITYDKSIFYQLKSIDEKIAMFAISEGILLSEIKIEYSKLILEAALRKNIKNFIDNKELYLSKFSSTELLALNDQIITIVDYIDDELLKSFNVSSDKIYQKIKKYNKISFNLLKFLMLNIKEFSQVPLSSLINGNIIPLYDDQKIELLKDYSKYQQNCLFHFINTEEYLKFFIENNKELFENSQKEILFRIFNQIQMDVIKKYFKEDSIESTIDTLIERIEKSFRQIHLRGSSFNLLIVNVSILKLANQKQMDYLCELFIEYDIWIKETFSILNQKASKVIVSKIRKLFEFLFERQYSFDFFLVILKEIVKCPNLSEFDLIELYSQITTKVHLQEFENEYIELIKKHPNFKGLDTAEIVFNSIK